MKKILLIALVLTGLTLNAQYFHSIYGTTDGQKLSDGINTNVLGLGHFLVGHAGQNGLSVSRTDVNGNVPGAPYFNGWYQISSSITGAVVNVGESKTFEMDNGAGFGIIGQFTDISTTTANSGVFYLQLDPAGNVNNIFTYLPGGGAAVDVRHVGGVSESVISGGNEVYVTGSTTDGGGRLDAFAMKLDVNSGNIVWTGVYDIGLSTGPGLTSAWDIIESPYAPVGIDEVIVVGGIAEPSGAPLDGFTMRLDANSGNPIGGVDIYGTSASTDQFYAIDIANSGAGGNVGFVLGGESDANNGTLDFWVMKTDPTLGTLWTTMHEYNGTNNATNGCLDVIERLNTAGTYEYYAAGYAIKGVLGDYDMVVMKLDANGRGVATGQFTYGDSKFDYGVTIDQYNNTGADGISVFGFRQGATGPIINGNYDMYLVKAYFNGQTPCNQKLLNVLNARGPRHINNVGVGMIDNLNDDVQFNWNIANAYDFTVCFSTSVTGGSNARIAPKEERADKQGIVSPNPVQAGTSTIDVTIETKEATTAQVAIYDMLGRAYYNGTVMLHKGENTLPVDISRANMSAGTYNVRVSYANENKTILLLVK